MTPKMRKFIEDNYEEFMMHGDELEGVLRDIRVKRIADREAAFQAQQEAKRIAEEKRIARIKEYYAPYLLSNVLFPYDDAEIDGTADEPMRPIVLNGIRFGQAGGYWPPCEHVEESIFFAIIAQPGVVANEVGITTATYHPSIYGVLPTTLMSFFKPCTEIDEPVLTQARIDEIRNQCRAITDAAETVE